MINKKGNESKWIGKIESTPPIASLSLPLKLKCLWSTQSTSQFPQMRSKENMESNACWLDAINNFSKYLVQYCIYILFKRKLQGESNDWCWKNELKPKNTNFVKRTLFINSFCIISFFDVNFFFLIYLDYLTFLLLVSHKY